MFRCAIYTNKSNLEESIAGVICEVEYVIVLQDQHQS